MAFGDNLKALGDRYKAYKATIKQDVAEALEESTQIAVDVATSLTPPVEGDGPRGENALTNTAKPAWELDSIVTPMTRGNEIYTVLQNNTPYISYLNDGHIVDMHFVPHLFKNEVTGLLDKIPSQSGGIVVGTQTKFIQGLYMKDLALIEYDKQIKQRLGRGVLRYAISRRG